MNILILGGHGFIGHHVAQQLSSQGHRVSVVDCHHRYGDYATWEYQPVLLQRLNYMGPHTFYQGVAKGALMGMCESMLSK